VIDFIFIKKGPIEVERHGVITDTLQGRQLSDHRPVIADIIVSFAQEETPRREVDGNLSMEGIAAAGRGAGEI